MTRWEAFITICSYLRAGLLGGHRELKQNLTWELIIEVASFHYITPVLAWCLRKDECVPTDVRDYFEASLALNMERNRPMLAGLARFASLLNAIDIEPVLLKGAALIVDGSYPEPSLRILGDVDVLIPATRSAECVAALQAARFTTKSSDVIPPPDHIHLPMLHDPETGMGVELHTDVTSQSADAVISTAWFCEVTRPILFQGHRVRLPEHTRNVGHVIFHSQVFHWLYSKNKIQLRHLLDMALISAQNPGAINWTELDHRFSAAGLGELLATYLQFSNELLGQPAPRLSHVPRADAMAALRETESRDSFHFQIEDLKSSNKDLQCLLSQTMANRDHLRSEVDQMNTELENANRTRGELERKLTGLRSESTRLSTELENTSRARGELQRELENANRARGELERELTGLQSESTRLSTELENANRARGELERELTGLQSESTRLSTELEKTSRARRELERTVKEILSSRTWRLTQPLRAVVGAARRWLR